MKINVQFQENKKTFNAQMAESNEEINTDFGQTQTISLDKVLGVEVKDYEGTHNVVDPTTKTATIDLSNYNNFKYYTSIERLASYLYQITFNTIPAERDITNVSFSGGCTSFVRDGKLYRNLDWDYDNTAEFRVCCKGFTGTAFISGLNDGNLNDYVKLSQLPYYISDGKNENGIMVSTHVLYNDWNYNGCGAKSTLITKLPYIILTTLKSINDISLLNQYLSNIKINQYLKSAEYLLQFLVTDGITTYIITPPTNDGESYQIINATSNPKLANFKWVDRAIVNRTDDDIQLRPTGIERWNMINESTTLEDLKFTNCYINPTRLSEFIGLRHTDKYSTDEELIEIYNDAHELYLRRERDGQTWQTLHSIIYSKDGIEKLYTQENYDINHIAEKGEKGDTGEQGPQGPAGTADITSETVYLTEVD